MRLLLVNFAGLAAMAFLQIHCQAGDEVLKEKIVRATLNHNEPALIRVGTNGVTSLEFPYKIEAIDGYGFSPTPGAGDAFQISYTKGTNYFSVRALKPGVTGNLTIVLDQKAYAVFFEESSNPSFVNIFAAANEDGPAAPGERDVAEKKVPESNSEGITFSQPPGDYLPTARTTEHSQNDPDVDLAPKPGTDQPPQPSPSPENHPRPKRAVKKADPKPEKSAKESVAKMQKPVAKKLFGWL
jgi:hypothetical protein